MLVVVLLLHSEADPHPDPESTHHDEPRIGTTMMIVVLLGNVPLCQELLSQEHVFLLRFFLPLEMQRPLPAADITKIKNVNWNYVLKLRKEI